MLLLDVHDETGEYRNGQLFRDVFRSIKDIDFDIDFPAESSIDLCIELSTAFEDQHRRCYVPTCLAISKSEGSVEVEVIYVVFLCNLTQSIGDTCRNRFILSISRIIHAYHCSADGLDTTAGLLNRRSEG